MGNENSLWRSSFLPPAKQAVMLAKGFDGFEPRNSTSVLECRALILRYERMELSCVLTELRDQAEQELIEALEEELNISEDGTLLLNRSDFYHCGAIAPFKKDGPIKDDKQKASCLIVVGQAFNSSKNCPTQGV